MKSDEEGAPGNPAATPAPPRYCRWMLPHDPRVRCGGGHVWRATTVINGAATARCQQCQQLLIVIWKPLWPYKLVAHIDQSELEELTVLSTSDSGRIIAHLQMTPVRRHP